MSGILEFQNLKYVSMYFNCLIGYKEWVIYMKADQPPAGGYREQKMSGMSLPVMPHSRILGAACQGCTL
jgi:hypothetical protein